MQKDFKEDVYIINAKRTSIGKFGGGLKDIPATQIATYVIKELLRQTPQIVNHIDEVVLGNVLSAGLGQNPARIAAFQSGISQKVPAFTINKVCGSSLKSIILGTQAIQNDDAQVIVAGGMENMSRAPYLLENVRFGSKTGHQEIKDTMVYDGLFCSLIGEPMGATGEYVAKKYNISREKQDLYAVSSHKKALLAIATKKFVGEIVPVLSFTTDEQPRSDASLAALNKLRPAFKKDGSVTAGNASTLNDAASAVIIASKRFVKKHRIKPMARIVSFASVGLNPRFMGMGAYFAAKKCLAKAKRNISDIDLWEVNEAFAGQTLAVIKLLGVSETKVNVNGGALALGHPIGASGARILTTLLYELKRQSKQYGLVSLCIGGGQGIAMLVERI